MPYIKKTLPQDWQPKTEKQIKADFLQRQKRILMQRERDARELKDKINKHYSFFQVEARPF